MRRRAAAPSRRRAIYERAIKTTTSWSLEGEKADSAGLARDLAARHASNSGELKRFLLMVLARAGRAQSFTEVVSNVESFSGPLFHAFDPKSGGFSM